MHNRFHHVEDQVLILHHNKLTLHKVCNLNLSLRRIIEIVGGMRKGLNHIQLELQHKFWKTVVHNLHLTHSAPHCDLSLSV